MQFRQLGTVFLLIFLSSCSVLPAAAGEYSAPGTATTPSLEAQEATQAPSAASFVPASSFPGGETTSPPPTVIQDQPQPAYTATAPPTQSMPLAEENQLLTPDAVVNPLTGLAVSDPTRLERNPIAIKIPNYPRNVRPQSGLSLADIVYEYYLERFITRFIAIFYGNDAEKAGPVRSARFFDEHIFRMYQSIFVFGNADDRVMDYFMTLGEDIVDRFVLERPDDKGVVCAPDQATPLCRDKAIVSYNNLFANTRLISERSEPKAQPNLSGMTFSDQVPPDGQPGKIISLYYSAVEYSQWIYDEHSARYLRVQDQSDANLAVGKTYSPLLDALNQSLISAANVVVLFVPHEYFVNTPTTEIIKIHLVERNRAILYRDGQAFLAQWIRPEGEGVLYLQTPQGKPLAFKPGNTFFQVIGVVSSFQHNGDYWDFQFAIP